MQSDTNQAIRCGNGKGVSFFFNCSGVTTWRRTKTRRCPICSLIILRSAWSHVLSRRESFAAGGWVRLAVGWGVDGISIMKLVPREEDYDESASPNKWIGHILSLDSPGPMSRSTSYPSPSRLGSGGPCRVDKVWMQQVVETSDWLGSISPRLRLMYSTGTRDEDCDWEGIVAGRWFSLQLIRFSNMWSNWAHWNMRLHGSIQVEETEKCGLENKNNYKEMTMAV